MKLQKQIIVYNEWLVSEKCRVSWGGCDGIAAKRPAVQTALAVYSETVIKWMWYAREGFSADVDIPRDSYWGEIELWAASAASHQTVGESERRGAVLFYLDAMFWFTGWRNFLSIWTVNYWRSVHVLTFDRVSVECQILRLLLLLKKDPQTTEEGNEWSQIFLLPRILLRLSFRTTNKYRFRWTFQ